jgi:hypothetical protein
VGGVAGQEQAARRIGVHTKLRMPMMFFWKIFGLP